MDVDKEGFASGCQLSVRAKISMFDPLVRGFFPEEIERRQGENMV